MRRTILSSLILALALLAAVEAVAWLALWLAGGAALAVAPDLGEGSTPAVAEVATEGAAGPHHEVVHPFLGFVRDPGWRDAPWGGIGPQGFFGAADHAPATGGNPFIVAVFGGSVANHFAFLGREALVAELERLPGLGDREIRVRSFALGGYKQPQQLFALSWLLTLGDEPDLVINLDGFNDVALAMENLERGTSPFYPRDWDRRAAGLPDLAALRLAGEIAAAEHRRRSRAGSCTGALSWSGVCRVVRRSLVAATDRRLMDLREELASRPPAGDGFLAAGPAFEPPPPPPGGSAEEEALAALADYWARCSLLMDLLCRARGIPYHHFLQPNQYVEGSKPMGTPERRRAFDPDHRYRRAARLGYPFLLAAGAELRSRGVEFHDLTRVFADVDEPLYTDRCCHFDRRGNELVAEAVGRAVRTGRSGVAPVDH